MHRRSVALLGVAVCCVLFLSLRTVAPADDTKTSTIENVDEFGDGILMFASERTAGIEAKSESVLLTSARLVKMGNRYFVRGKGYLAKEYQDNSDYNWWTGADSAYAWEHVYRFSVLTPEQLEAYYASQKNRAER